MRVTCAQRSVCLWSGEGRCWWESVGDEDDGGDDSGGIATGTQKRGSKQGEALTSACFTFERDRARRRGREEEILEVEKQHKGEKRDKQGGGAGESCGLSATATGRQAGAVQRHSHREATEHRKSHSQSCGLQSGGCGARSPVCRSDCVPLVSGFPHHQAPPQNADPATSLAAEGEHFCQMLENGSNRRPVGASGEQRWMLPCWGGWGCSPLRTHTSPCLRWGSWSEPGLPPSIWASLMGCSLKTHTSRAGGQNTDIQGHKHMSSAIVEEALKKLLMVHMFINLQHIRGKSCLFNINSVALLNRYITLIN